MIFQRPQINTRTEDKCDKWNNKSFRKKIIRYFFRLHTKRTLQCSVARVIRIECGWCIRAILNSTNEMYSICFNDAFVRYAFPVLSHDFQFDIFIVVFWVCIGKGMGRSVRANWRLRRFATANACTCARSTVIAVTKSSTPCAVCVHELCHCTNTHSTACASWHLYRDVIEWTLVRAKVHRFVSEMVSQLIRATLDPEFRFSVDIDEIAPNHSLSSLALLTFGTVLILISNGG